MSFAMSLGSHTNKYTSYEEKKDSKVEFVLWFETFLEKGFLQKLYGMDHLYFELLRFDQNTGGI